MKQIKRTHLVLESGQTYRIAPDAPGTEFNCDSGTAWITMAEDPTDYILGAGQHLLLAGRRPAVIQALRRLEFDLIPRV